MHQARHSPFCLSVKRIVCVWGGGGGRLTVNYYNALHSRACVRRFSLFMEFGGPPKDEGGGGSRGGGGGWIRACLGTTMIRTI